MIPVWFCQTRDELRRDIWGGIYSWTFSRRFRMRISACYHRGSKDVVRVVMVMRNVWSTLDTRKLCENDSTHDIWADICIWTIYRIHCTDRSFRCALFDVAEVVSWLGISCGTRCMSEWIQEHVLSCDIWVCMDTWTFSRTKMMRIM